MGMRVVVHVRGYAHFEKYARCPCVGHRCSDSKHVPAPTMIISSVSRPRLLISKLATNYGMGGYKNIHLSLSLCIYIYIYIYIYFCTQAALEFVM